MAVRKMVNNKNKRLAVIYIKIPIFLGKMPTTNFYMTQNVGSRYVSSHKNIINVERVGRKFCHLPQVKFGHGTALTTTLSIFFCQC